MWCGLVVVSLIMFTSCKGMQFPFSPVVNYLHNMKLFCIVFNVGYRGFTRLILRRSLVEI